MNELKGRFNLIMSKYRILIWIIVPVLLSVICILSFIEMAAAQGHVVRQGEYLDSRHGHGHYYPARGGYVTALPRGHAVVVYRGGNYYHYGGVWYRASGAGFVIVGPPVGIVVPVLPPYYATVWVGAVPYYYANEAYYVQAPGGYIVVDPPPQAASSPPPSAVGPAGPPSPADYSYIYPRQGQGEKQQADDRYACHRWAVGQTAYDPTQPPPGITAAEDTQKRADYHRAMGACLEARGYSVK
jgi:hypothetical protein